VSDGKTGDDKSAPMGFWMVLLGVGLSLTATTRWVGWKWALVVSAAVGIIVGIICLGEGEFRQRR